MHYGDEIIIRAWGQEYVYEVRYALHYVDPFDTSLLAHQDFPWLTLITCHGYDPVAKTYQWRVGIQAIQTDIR